MRNEERGTSGRATILKPQTFQTLQMEYATSRFIGTLQTLQTQNAERGTRNILHPLVALPLRLHNFYEFINKWEGDYP